MQKLRSLLRWLRWLALACLFAGAASSSLAAKTYSDNGDGTVTDPTTGLIWMRCSMGQTWDGTTCTGTASTHTFDQANALTGTVTFAAHSDWRLPNIRELTTLADRSRSNPAIDINAFPNTPAQKFWSASASVEWLIDAWGVDFIDGATSNYYYWKTLDMRVRLVRSGQLHSALLNPARPDPDYVDNGNGTVTHTPTGLMWKRCAEGQTWTDSTCTGNASSYSWAEATSLTQTIALQGGWRLPTVTELETLVDYTKFDPSGTLNSTLFPKTPASYFWSAAAYAANVWRVDFGHGYTYVDRENYGYQIRLVRAEQSFGPLTLTVQQVGTGQVTSSVWPLYQCASLLCSGGYNVGDVVTLSATPAANLISWGGACANAGTAATCTLTMDAAKTVTASFIVSGQGTWESTLLGRDAAGHAVAASSPNAAFLYDTTLDVTWLKNANANGQMTWQDAQAWVQSLQVGGFAGWRLPKTLDPDASCGTSNANPAVYSNGYGINCMGSEMGHLFNVSLGNAPDKAITNTGNFENVQGYYYWSGTPLASNLYYVWTYQTSINGQAYTGTGTNPFFALAVRDGDVLVPTPQPGSTTALNLQPGWNLLGNGQNQPLAVATLLGDPLKVTSVWKWDVTQSGWQFYAPSMDASALQTYATSKNYGVLSTINAGEGFWVNAAKAFISSYQNGTAITGIDFQAGKPAAMKPGWNLVAIGNSVTPSAFNVGLGTSPPSPGVVPVNLTTLWAWDSTQSKWYFYAPSFEAQGGTALIDYVTGKGYLDFTTGSKKLGPGVGFWVNRP